MKNSHKLLGVIAVLLALSALACGCTDSGATAPATQTATPVVTVEETPAEAETEWVIWREGGSQTLNALGGYQTFSPNVNGEMFKELKIEVRSDNPITVMFLSNAELKNFTNKMSTNQGEYTPVSRYDNVNYQVLEQSSDDYLNIALYNPSDRLAVVDAATIWYKV
ncbi:MAG: hypothetical protein JW931_00730 [Methanomicrobiaceae archaeon]|nr:hypothetical protein [Methanomicrobiaceae archaeon]